MRSHPGRAGAEIARAGLFTTALLTLTAAPAAAYETVVTAPRDDARPRADVAASASVVTGDRPPRSAETLPQLLGELPGVSVTRLGGLGALATVSLRGSAPNQVQVYLDGVPLSTATWGSVDVGAIPVTQLERLEVYRGTTPIAFGSSGLGGVVALESRVPAFSGVAAHAGGGSWGTRLAGAEGAWAGRRVRVLVAANHLASDGDYPYVNSRATTLTPDDDQETRRGNNALAQTDALLRLAVPLGGRRELLASASLFVRDKGLPPSALFEPHGASLGTQRALASVAYASRDDLGAGGQLRVVGYAAATKQELRDPNGELTFTPTHTHDRNLAVGAAAHGSGLLASWARLAAVVDARHERFAPFDEHGNTPTGPPCTRLFGAAGLETTLYAPGALDVLPSARVEAARDQVRDRTGLERWQAELAPRTYLLPMARLGLRQRPLPWLTLRGNAARYARLPTTFERYGNTGNVVGEPDLRPETGVNADLGAVAVLGAADGTGLSLDAAVFAARVSDLIDFQAGGNKQKARNVGEARILGVEGALAARAGPHLRLLAQATFTDARDVGELASSRGRQIPHRPRLRAYLRPETRALPLGRRFLLGAHADLDATSGNFIDAANLVPRGRRLLFGAGLSLDAPGGWRVVATATNLGDARVVDLAGYPLPGRSLLLTLHYAYTQPKETVP